MAKLKRTSTPSDVTDDDALQAVRTLSGVSIRIWDDGFGPLWVYRETMGVVGVVRAETWEDAHSCVVDEIMSDADIEDEDNQPDAHGNFPEGLCWRGSGVPSNDGLDSPLAAEDLNGSRLEPLTDTLADELGLEIELAL